MQRLHALVGAIAADGEVTEEELRGLSTWLAEHDHLKMCWPYDEIDSIVTSQHQRMRDCGIDVSRPWLTQLMQSTGALLEPIHDAQLASIRTSRVKAMDEMPIKAGPAGTGKMKAACFWPVYGGAG